MRLLLDVDNREPEQVARCIDWCQQDSFWRGHIQSPGKLREKYNTLRQQAKAQRDRELEQERAAQNGARGRRPDPGANMPQPPPASAIAVPPPDIGDDPAAYLEWQRGQQAARVPAVAPSSRTEAFG
jgi:hypothetical protein